jgi:dUTP pyrophosphatase
MLKIYLVNEKATMPSFATEGSACFDVRACINMGSDVISYNTWNKKTKLVPKVISGKTSIQITPGDRALVPTGLIFDIPKNNVLKLYNRSSTGLKKGLILPNSVGIIDSDYVEESFIMMQNVSESLVVIQDGERLAQAMLEPVKKYAMEQILDRPGQKTSRDGGFGSTGSV